MKKVMRYFLELDIDYLKELQSLQNNLPFSTKK